MPERSLSPQRLAYLRAQKRRRRVVLALQVLLLSELLQVLLLVLQQDLLQVRRLSVLLQQLHCIHCH